MWFFFIIFVIIIGYYIYKAITCPWSKALTIEEYAKQHPESKTRNGMTCAFCGSRSIRNWGLDNANSVKRLHQCNHCGKTLYRS